MLTEHQLEIAARKLCEMRGIPPTDFACGLAVFDIQRVGLVNQAIAYAVVQKEKS